MDITIAEAVQAIQELGATCYINAAVDSVVTEQNYDETFLTISHSQADINKRPYADYTVLDYTTVYNQVMRNRRQLEYGTWQQQLNMMYDGTWNDYVAGVKTKYPFI